MQLKAPPTWTRFTLPAGRAGAAECRVHQPAAAGPLHCLALCQAVSSRETRSWMALSLQRFSVAAAAGGGSSSGCRRALAAAAAAAA